MSTPRRTTRRPTLFLAFTLAACAGDSPEAGIRSDSAGIEIVRFPGGDRPARVALTEELRLGGSETDPNQSFFHVSRGTVGTDAQGNIYVLDMQARRVVVFDGDGTFLGAMGRSGGGPGELGFPGGLVVSAEGRAGVIDFSKRGIVRYDTDGTPLPVEPMPGTYFGGDVHLAGDVLVHPGNLALDGGRRTDALYRITGTDTTTLVIRPPAETKPIQLESCGMGFSGMPPLFTPTLRWAARDAQLAVAYTTPYDIAIFEDGREVRRVRRDVPPRAATEELAVRQLGDGMSVRTEGGVRVCEAREVVQQQGFAPTIPAVGTLAIAPDGRLWVQHGGLNDEPKAIDLFDPDGEYIGTLPPGSPFPLLFLPDGRMAAGETDELDVTRLVVYRLDVPD